MIRRESYIVFVVDREDVLETEVQGTTYVPQSEIVVDFISWCARHSTRIAGGETDLSLECSHSHGIRILGKAGRSSCKGIKSKPGKTRSYEKVTPRFSEYVEE